MDIDAGLVVLSISLSMEILDSWLTCLLSGVSPIPPVEEAMFSRDLYDHYRRNTVITKSQGILNKHTSDGKFLFFKKKINRLKHSNG